MYTKKKKKNDEYRDAARSAATIAGLGYVGNRANNAGLERVLGVQRFTHGTSNDAGSSIRKAGLLASKGGGAAGSSAGIGSEQFVNNSKGRVHISTDNFLGRAVAKLHSGISEINANNPSGRAISIGEGYGKGDLVYGAMPYSNFKANFEQDPDHLPGRTFRSTSDIDAKFLKRGKGRVGALGILKNVNVKDIPGYIANNKGRAALGAGYLGIAGLSANKIRKEVGNLRGRYRDASIAKAKRDAAQKTASEYVIY